VIFVVAILPEAEMLEAFNEFDRLDPVDLPETQLASLRRRSGAPRLSVRGAPFIS
jgi:hypothetical protein